MGFADHLPCTKRRLQREQLSTRGAWRRVSGTRAWRQRVRREVRPETPAPRWPGPQNQRALLAARDPSSTRGGRRQNPARKHTLGPAAGAHTAPLELLEAPGGWGTAGCGGSSRLSHEHHPSESPGRSPRQNPRGTVKKRRQQMSPNSGLEMDFSKMCFFSFLLPQMPNITSLPTRVLMTSHPLQRAMQPPKSSKKDHACPAAPPLRTATPRRRWPGLLRCSSCSLWGSVSTDTGLVIFLTSRGKKTPAAAPKKLG